MNAQLNGVLLIACDGRREWQLRAPYEIREDLEMCLTRSSAVLDERARPSFMSLPRSCCALLFSRVLPGCNRLAKH